MKLGKVEKQTLLYTLLKAYSKFTHDIFFYKKITYIGKENIPKDKPVLIAPNHQNALMDAAAIVLGQKIQPIFLARSDIFKKPIIAKILFALKILPVFRIRDGKDKMHLNDLIYNKTMEVLELHRQVVIFPEAQHIDKKHVRKLKKGIQRIGFMLEEKNDFKTDTQIIPTGIYYSNYWNYKTKLVVKYGKPICLRDYKDEFYEDSEKAILKVNNILHEKIKEQVIHIEDLDYHDEYDLLRDINEEQLLKELLLSPNAENKLKADQETVKKVDILKSSDSKVFLTLMEKVKNYGEQLKKYKLKDWVVKENGKNNNFFKRVLLLLIASPIFVYGFINNIISYLLPRLITTKIKDRQFVSSIVFVFFMFAFPVIYTIQAVVIWIVFKIWYVTLIYFVTLPLLGMFAFDIHRLFVKTNALLRFSRMKKRGEMGELITLRKEILKIIE